MKDIKLSIIVPVYNTEKYIHQCVDSIINQTYDNLEIILVDDGSPDGCGTICDEYAKTDKRIRVIHKDNGGSVSTRKAGVELASGDYITFVDSDDWIDENAYQNAIDVISAMNIDVFIFALKKIYDSHTVCEHENLPSGYLSRSQIYDEKSKIEKNHIKNKKIATAFCWNKVIRSGIVKNNIPLVDDMAKIGEDASMMYPCLLASNSFYISYEPYYNYRMNNTSVLHRHNANKYKSVNKVVNRISEAVRYHNLDSNEIIMKQLRLYTFDLMLITDTCHFVENIRILYPQIKPNSRILFYGRGVYAQNLAVLAEKDETLKIVGYIDSSTLDKLNDYEYDYVIIAVTISAFVEDIIENLRKYSIDMEKVLYLKNSYVYKLMDSNEELQMAYKHCTDNTGAL